MKRLGHVLYLILAIFLLSACANTQEDHQQRPTDLIGDEPQEMEERETEDALFADKESAQILVAYFSWAENAVQDDIDAMTSASVKVGNELYSFYASKMDFWIRFSERIERTVIARREGYDHYIGRKICKGKWSCPSGNGTTCTM